MEGVLCLTGIVSLFKPAPISCYFPDLPRLSTMAAPEQLPQQPGPASLKSLFLIYSISITGQTGYSIPESVRNLSGGPD